METTDAVLDEKESFDFLKGAKRIRVKVAMQEYARIKCEEQRELCAKECQSPWDRDAVRNAKEPELE